MATTESERATTGPKRRASGRASDGDGELDQEREEQYDLLTAAVIGMALGAGIALLMRRGPSGRRPIVPALAAMGTGARWAGSAGLRGARWAGDTIPPVARRAGRHAREGAGWARERGEEMLERLPPLDDVTETVRDYVDAAREAISDTVEHEVHDLRKAIRRQRKRIGI